MQNSQDKRDDKGGGGADDALETLLRDAVAYLEYVALAGVDLLPLGREGVGSRGVEPAECAACPFSKTREAIFEGLGGECPKLAFVCDVPPPASSWGTARYSPFTGEKGQLLRRIIEAAQQKAGLGEDDMAILFAIRCVPPKNRERAQLEEAFEACAPLLREGLACLAPPVVLAFGDEALRALTGPDGQAPQRGALTEIHGMKVILTHGLDDLLRDDDQKTLRTATWSHIQRALKVLEG